MKTTSTLSTNKVRPISAQEKKTFWSLIIYFMLEILERQRSRMVAGPTNRLMLGRSPLLNENAVNGTNDRFQRWPLTRRVFGWSFILLYSISFCLSHDLLAQANKVDVYNYIRVNNSRPTLEEVVSYTLVVGNDGSTSAAGVVVKDSLPASLQYVSHTIIKGPNSFAVSTGRWNIGTLAPGDSVVMLLQAKVVARGLGFNQAEVVAMQGTDVDSQPNNQSLQEDDYSSACLSVPIYWYPGDEFTVTAPTGSNVQWTRNGNLINAQYPSDTATASGNSLVIKAPGTYAFTAMLATCPASGCCAIEVVQGPCGSIGDFVWLDINSNGVQDAGEPGVANVKVDLYTDTGSLVSSTTTGPDGKYGFGCVLDGKYKVKFNVPAGTIPTTPNQRNTPGDKNSDAGQNGFSHVITIDVSKQPSDTLRNNLTIDAGFVPYGSLGDYVWLDTNRNGVQDPSEVGVANLKVELYGGAGATLLKTTYTDSNGRYLFDSLLSGPYKVHFILPAGNKFTAQDQGSNDALDSDAGLDGYTAVVQIDATKSITDILRVNKTIDAGIYPVCSESVPLTVQNPASVCAGQPVTLTATSLSNQISWYTSSTGGTAFAVVSSGASVTVTPANSGTNLYYVEASTADNCLSNRKSVSVIVSSPLTTSALASSSSVCAGSSVSLAAGVSGGQGPYQYSWSGPSGFTSSLASVSLVPSSSGSYTVVVTSATGCSATATVTMTVLPVPAVTLINKINPTSCADNNSGSLTLGGLSASQLYTVNYTYNNGNETSRSLTTDVSGQITLSGLASGLYTITVGQNNCTSQPVTATLTSPGAPVAPTVAISPSVTVCLGKTVTLMVTGLPGAAFQWTGNGLSATTGSSVTVNPATVGANLYTVTQTVNGCVSAPAPVTITGVQCTTCTTEPPVISCATTHVCPSDAVVLHADNCNGTIIWSSDKDGSFTGSSLTVYPTVTTTYTAQCKTDNCLSALSKPVTIYVNDPQPPVITANADTVCAGGSVRLTATGCSLGKVVWSNGMTGTSIYVAVNEPTTFYANCRINNCISGPSVPKTIHIGALPVPKVTCSTDHICPGDSVTLRILNCSGTPVWSYNNATTESITVSPMVTTSYTVICKNGNCVSPVSQAYVIKVSRPQPPALDVSADTVCLGSQVKLTAMGCSGTVIWSTGATGSSIQVAPATNMSYSAFCKVGNCTSETSKSVEVVVVNPSAPIIRLSKTLICAGESVLLTAEGCDGGRVKWSNNMTGNSITVMPGATTNYTAACQISACTSVASNMLTVNVTNSNAPAPTVVASATAVCKGTPVTLTASGCAAGTISWSNGATGNTIVVSPGQTTEYYAACKMGTQCNSAPARVTIQVNTPPTPKIHVCKCTNGRICLGDTVTLSAEGCNGTPVWSTGATTTSIMVTPSVTTEYTVACSGNGCVSDPSAAYTVVVSQPTPPVVTASKLTVEKGDSVTLTAKGCEGGQIIWSTGATGSSILVMPTATTDYYAECKINGCLSEPGKITIRINGDCGLPQPLVQASATTVCYGGSVTLTATGCSQGTVVWSNNSTGISITIPSLVSTTTYTAVCKLDANCSSQPSAPVTVRIKSDTLMSPLVPMMARNVCPATTVDLTKVVESSPITPGGVFEYHTGNTPSSPLVSQPRSVGQGVFYIFERTTAGCYSLPAEVDVSVFNCATDTCRSDLFVIKTVDNPYPKVGEVVTYTIKLGNHGSCPATHSDFRDILPKGLELVSVGNMSIAQPTGYLSMWVTRLAPNDTLTYYYKARVTAGGPIVNTAKITYLDQVDPNESNNASSVTIQDTTAASTMAIGLAKSLKSVRKLSTDLYEFAYGLDVTNYSSVDATTVQITDDVQSVFAPHSIESAVLTLSKATTLQANVNYTGKVNHTQLLDAASVVKAGQTEHLLVTVTVRMNLQADTTMTFYNQAYLTAKLNSKLAEDASTSGSDADPDKDGNPGNNSEPTPAKFNEQLSSKIGVALAAIRIVPQPDNSYNVTYKATVKNYSSATLTNVQLVDNLAQMITVPATFSVVSSPVVGTGSSLKPNTGFDGRATASLLDASGSTLAAGAMDTVLVTVNVKPNGLKGPIYTQVVGSAKAGEQEVTDLSNSGIDPQPFGSTPTGVRFDLPGSLLGVAKSIDKVEDLGNGVFRLKYTIKLTNLGFIDLKKVQVVDDLTQTFGSDVVIGPGAPELTAEAGLVVNTNYTGQGLLTNLLVDSLSTLPVGSTRSLSLNLRVDVHNSQQSIFNNTAIATAFIDGSTMVSDTSTAGSNVDPDNDLDPRNNNTPTPVTLNALPVTAHIGVAMAVSDTNRQADGRYKVTYQIVVKNYSAVELTNVLLSDTLAHVFNGSAGATYTLVGAPVVSAGSQLVVNPAYDGNKDVQLLAPSSTLAVGRADTVQVTLLIATDGRSTPYFNSARAIAIAGVDTVSDLSANGLEPDLNGNNNPTDLYEDEATPLSFPIRDRIFIPEGFSPNNDGINDRFVIENTGGATVSLEVFNRWGNAVYRSLDYKNDWDGAANTGIQIGSGSKGVPEGTYFYVIQLSDGRKFARYITISR